VPFNDIDIFYGSFNMGLLALLASISHMGIDRCFRPSQVIYLSLNTKDDLHDHLVALVVWVCIN
jgi:hypothetical protein